jgi:hypothetical protein
VLHRVHAGRRFSCVWEGMDGACDRALTPG